MSEFVAVRGTLGNYALDSLYRLDRYVGAGRVGDLFHAWARHHELRQAYDRHFMPSLVEEMVQDDLVAQKQREGYLRQHIRRYGKRLLPEELSLVLRTKFALDPRMTVWQEAGTLKRSVETVAQPDGRVEELVRVPVAVKLLRTATGEGQSEMIRRVIREWRAQAKVIHPNLIGVLDTGTGRLRLEGPPSPAWTVRDHEYCPYVVLEHLPGALSPAHAAKLNGNEQVAAIRQAAAGLRALHAQGLLHRDIHPGNLLITRTSGTLIAKLAEFSVLPPGVNVIEPGWDRKETAGYRSPEEMIDGRHQGPATDLYSLAATLYFYSFGRPPYANVGDAQRILERKLAGEMPDFPTGYHDFLISILKRGLAADPAYRYGSLKEFLRDLDLYAKILQREPVELQSATNTIEMDRTLLNVPRPLPDTLRPNQWKSAGAAMESDLPQVAVASRSPSGGLDAEYPGHLTSPLPARMVSGRLEIMRISPQSDLPELPGSSESGHGGTRSTSVGARRVTGARRRKSGEQPGGRIPTGATTSISGRQPAAMANQPASAAVLPEEPPAGPFTRFLWIGLVAVVGCLTLAGVIFFLRSTEPPRVSPVAPPTLTALTDKLSPASPVSTSGPETAAGSLAAQNQIDTKNTDGATTPESLNPALPESTADLHPANPLPTPQGSPNPSPGSKETNTALQPSPTPATGGLVDYARFQPVPATGKHSKRVTAVVFSPDGRKLVTVSEDQRAMAWAAADGIAICELRAPAGTTTGAMTGAAFEPRAGGALLISAVNGLAVTFRLEGEQPLATALPIPGSTITCVAFSRDSRLAFLGDAKGIGRFFSTADWQERPGKITAGGAIGRACFNKDGSQLVTAVKDTATGPLELWDVAGGARLKLLAEHKGWVSGLALSPDGATVLAADWLGNAIVQYNAADGSVKERILDPGAQPLSAVYSPDGHAIITGGRDTHVKVWDAATGRLIVKLAGTGENNYCRYVDVSPDGRCIAAGYEDGSFRLFRDPAAPLPGSGMFVDRRDTKAPAAVNLCERKEVAFHAVDADGKPQPAISADDLAHLHDGNLAGDGVAAPAQTAVVIDLGEVCTISAIKVYHDPRHGHKYLDQVWQLGDAPQFDGHVLTVFNNDSFDTHGLGRGKDFDYVAAAEGKQISFAPVQARYVRIVCGGNETDSFAHLLEIQVYGTVGGH
ncbi:MAG TPA: protein kinase [Planctomycetota bacterium]|nr:protein kinase [Planctomycetota bacterium]